MAQYWVGDIHLFHEKVAAARGFSSVEEHNAVIIDQLSQIREEDQVTFVGDITGGHGESIVKAFEVLDRFKFGKRLIYGNHDSPSSIHKNGWRHQREWLKHFDGMGDFARFSMNRETVLVSHYPYAALGDGDGRTGEPRYLPYRLADVGMPLLHAHTHQTHPFSKMREETITKIEYEGYDLNSLCVSWDARRGLTTESHVAQWLTMRENVKREQELERVRSYWSAFPKPSRV